MLTIAFNLRFFFKAKAFLLVYILQDLSPEVQAVLAPSI